MKTLMSMKIDPLVKKTIQKIAKRKGISMSALIHDALDSYILRDKGAQSLGRLKANLEANEIQAFNRHKARMEADRKEQEER